MLAEVHRRLAAGNRARLDPGLPSASWRADLAADHAHRRLEHAMLRAERLAVAARARTAPTEPVAFTRWFRALADSGPGQGDPLFPWLAERASAAAMRWFLRQEVAGEAGFEDLVALAQLRLPAQPKLELARNYWDEMGRGQEGGMHGPMLARLSNAVGVPALAAHVPVVWESDALGNLMLGMAANRSYAYHAIGALGAIELTAPGRAELVDRGLVRLDLAPRNRHYFALHATLDIKHADAWIEEVFAPIVAAEPTAAWALAEGALLRLEAGRRCFERYRAELVVGGIAPRARAAGGQVVAPAVVAAAS